MPFVVLRAGVVLTAVALAGCRHGATPASAPTPQLLARGDSIFHASTCTECHGRTAKGTAHGPSLITGEFAQTDGSYAAIVKVITTGVPEAAITNPAFPEPMPPRGGQPPLTDDQIRALAAYVYSISHR